MLACCGSLFALPSSTLLSEHTTIYELIILLVHAGQRPGLTTVSDDAHSHVSPVGQGHILMLGMHLKECALVQL